MKIQVMSFNIRYDNPDDRDDRWDARRDLVFKVVRERQPDLIGFQEPLLHQVDDLCGALPDYAKVGVGRDDGDRVGEQSPIFYRRDRFDKESEGTFWLSDTPGTPGSRSWGNSLPRLCTWLRLVERESGLAFYGYNTHLDHESQPSQERSLRLIHETIANRQRTDPVILTGDFNIEESYSILRSMKGVNSPTPVDTFRALHAREREAGTFHNFSGHRSGMKIDYIFVSPEWKILSSEIIYDNEGGRYPSDHFPLTAVVEYS